MFNILKLFRFCNQFESLERQVEKISMNMSDLKREIAEVKETAAKAQAKLLELAARIEACECDPIALAALVAELDEAQESLQGTVDSLSAPVDPVDSVDPPVV